MFLNIVQNRRAVGQEIEWTDGSVHIGAIWEKLPTMWQQSRLFHNNAKKA